MDALKEALQEAVYAANFGFECEILGSYRRGVPFSSDVDLAIWHKSFDGSKEHDALGKELLESVVQKLEERGLVKKENELARGVKKYAVSAPFLMQRTANRALNFRPPLLRVSFASPEIRTMVALMSAWRRISPTHTCCSARPVIRS